jgi:hypothetical protein
MSIRITAIRKPGDGPLHTAITELKWIDEANGQTDVIAREVLWHWIEGGGQAYVRDKTNDIVFVAARENIYGTKFVQTYADQTWKDNLLALPRF